MRAFHDSRDPGYRTPYGAVPVGTAVTLRLDVWDAPGARCTCRTWVDGVGEGLVPMEAERLGDRLRFSAEVTPDVPEILWYSFLVEGPDGAAVRYGAREGRTGGEGELRRGMPPSFQMTAYRPRRTEPDWYTGGIVYQIFPDRFRRGPGWEGLAARALGGPRRKGPERVLRQDWYAPPAYLRDDEGRVTAWDFYGGTLSGIGEELGYLEDLGVTAIYLNPIFEAESNHRYDTADYLAVDPMLGDEGDFRDLCSAAAARGISVILDGVFNHTGCDSVYFNKYGNYPGVGAYQSADSPYRDWYQIDEDGTTYCSWWGVDDLPDVDEENPAWRDFVFGAPDGVVRRWMRAGARGWRLDVADEMPDDFIAGIKGAVLETRPDGLLLGEVWEDASNKVSYGRLRRYFLGDELDGAMNYPLRDSLLPYLLGAVGAGAVAETIESLRENYPPEALSCCLNLLGSHDRARLLTVLGGAPDGRGLSEAERGAFRLDPGQRGLAKARLWLATLVQMTLPGVPCVYYGDEAGLEGYADPYNRAGFPWGREDRDCGTIYRDAISLRRSLPLFADGGLEPVACDGCGDDVLGFLRTDAGSRESACVLVNRSASETHEVRVPMRGEVASEVVSGQEVRLEGGEAGVSLGPLGSAVVYFHDADLLGAPMPRGSGVLCHVTSLPNEGAPGTLGAPARRFVDCLAGAGQRYWQVLPVGPTDGYGSPYAGLSAFAGNVRLLEGSGSRSADEDGYRDFRDQSDGWLAPYATFMAIRDAMGPGPWQDWPERYRAFDPDLARDPALAPGVEAHARAQFEFMRQWDELHAYASAHDVSIVGDMPMYVSEDSADAWARPDLFRLDASGHAAGRAGTPPDRFAREGQLWGNPTYDWDAMRADGYDWWVRRLERAFSLYDYVRLDHFLGFSAYYSIPEGESASGGRWRRGPGRELFERAHERLGRLPVVAEDLGSVTPAARMLVASCGFPGMDVVEFADGDVRQGYRPRAGKVAYTSTHDTQTLVGWCQTRYPDEDPHALARGLVRGAMGSDAGVVVVPLQDVMGLGDEARMNVPGVAEGNWRWQASWEGVEASAAWLGEVTRECGRA